MGLGCPPTMIKGSVNGAWCLQCRLECCLNCAPLLQLDNLGLGTALTMVVCLRTKPKPWTGRKLGWFQLVANIISWPKSVGQQVDSNKGMQATEDRI